MVVVVGPLENDGGALFKRWKHQPDPSIIILLPLTGVGGVAVKYCLMSCDIPWMPMVLMLAWVVNIFFFLWFLFFLLFLSIPRNYLRERNFFVSNFNTNFWKR